MKTNRARTKKEPRKVTPLPEREKTIPRMKRRKRKKRWCAMCSFDSH